MFLTNLIRRSKPQTQPIEVSVGVGMYNGEPMVSVLMVGDGFQDQLEAEAKARWDALSPEEQAAWLAEEEEELEMWRSWAREQVRP